ncbi:CpsD/CapB family tyrosine-protein kinase [Phenylobacterium sp.]|uniref:CpsD/CapB family tyrosine-protein kinase n=1 Tax=Phenylobacterium sp. TaxID=1871053 RepID=UPI0025FC7191|nr:CpsD/CapB family tyrosine-protein kinase [Phenylobacterium sp.]
MSSTETPSTPTVEVAGSAAAILPGATGPDVELKYEFSPDLVTLTDARPAEAEAIRTVRTHIMAQHLADGRRGIAICAATPGVGCSFTAANLAVALSQVGIATLLIDADLRAPQIESFIDPGGPTAGLKQYLETPDARPGDFIHDGVLPNLSVMYAGGVADNAQELLGSDRFKSLVDRYLRDFEFTIIDTPAASKVADALRISSMIGYTLIVAKAHSTRFNDVSLLAKQLQEDGAEVVGTVLNEV